MAQATRKKRPQSKRIKSIRTSTPANRAKPASAGTGKNESAIEVAVSDVESAVSDALADAVRLGYHVLAQNLEQGRAAAKQFRVGEYSVRSVPSDLSQLTQRMMRLARDLSLTTFDLMDKLMQDPAILNAARRIVADASGDDEKPAAAKPAATQKKVAPKPAPSTATVSPRFVPLTCTFPRGASASLEPSWLQRPDPPTTLATTALTTLSAGAPAIEGVTFEASDDGSGVVAIVPIPKDQPAGLYSGAIVNAESGLALGTLNIQVGA